MSSASVVIEIVDVHGVCVEFWSAEVPRGSDGAFSQRIGQDDPAFGLMMLAGSGGALAQRLAGVDIADPGWLRAHTQEHIASMELVTTAGSLSYTTGRELVDHIQSSPDFNAAVLACAPRALYRLTVTDPAALAHLRAGQVFESTAYSPLPPVPRQATHALSSMGSLGPLLAAQARLAANDTWHLFRCADEPDLPWRLESWAAQHKVFLSNALRARFLRRGRVQLIYFDPVPGFKKGKLRFKKGVAGATEVPGPASQPRGVFVQAPWRWGDPARGVDGVPRAPLDFLHPGGVAWVDLEGAPLLRVGSWSGVDPAAPTQTLEAHLAEAAARIAADADRAP